MMPSANSAPKATRAARRALWPAAALFAAVLAPASPAFAQQAGDPPARLPAVPGAPGSLLALSRPAPLPPAQSAQRLGAPLADARAERALPLGPFQVSASAALVSEYRFRGVRLSGGDPALQATVEVGLDSGFYLGGFASTIDQDTLGYGGAEFNTFAGWSGPVGDGITADLGAIAYVFPDAPLGDANYFEVYGSLAYQLGPGRLSVGAAFDPAARGIAFVGPRGVPLRRDNLYLHSDLRVGIPATGISVMAHVGYTDGWRGDGGRSPSLDWSLGAEWPLAGPLLLGLAYVDADSRLPLIAPAGRDFDPLAGSVVATLRIGI